MSYNAMVWFALGGNVLAWVIILALLRVVEFEDLEGESDEDYEMETAGDAFLDKIGVK